MIFDQEPVNLDYLYEVPLRLFDGVVPECARVVGTADEEFEDRMVVVFELKKAA